MQKRAKVEWTIEAILAPEDEVSALTLLEAKVAVIPHKKDISKVVQTLAEKYPLDKELLFLKRVKADKDKALIIVKVGKAIDGTHYEAVPGTEKELLTVEIPGKQPKSRAQFEAAKRLWPCHFHEDKRLEAILGRTLPEVWGDKAFNVHSSNMQRVLQTPRNSSGLVWDPKQNREVAFSWDTKEAHDLRHCTMNLIDCVAHAHGGGAWPLTNDCKGVQSDPNEKAYLLTDYDVYLSQEPCIMCSMALVHSRVARIFFAKNAPKNNGGLLSKARLQTISSLNHTFEVYKMTKNTT